MEPTTLAIAIATIFLTKALEKSGETFSESLTKKVGEALAKIRNHSPETATALVAGNPEALNLNPEVLNQIPDDPIFAELVTTADVEENATFADKYQALKSGGTINIIGKQINISQAGTGGTQTNNFSNF
ncbi:hypothetical protein H6G54_19420 [Anabaena cylindrica FACHB-243]|uniref:Uncharacterized protein n=1 Tax=Anabaena cylindrica (strain ATCC 27899 / PCC 7122) TaxID=272123 RepID=K9ZHH2_ANACC|nr:MULTISPECIES: hypothetical protein [Anabaena]AFZ58189.1 hypothetical protein Anacy_2754 [Anabaena cylindrica PCC 7122]MBD2419836.1 hypothetical protein [Anabaena cylindrica FACHB-243]MBY5280962.1 hypothetical protein [Anabaena sp. CCAP 1446/1C]MBY5311506.1 hypothetical protein [Anabaena sp. CCAP 1446/1C]MCM2407966.1 hypothetical protein [Anabaena sp. CCAP 1446/1C]